MPDTRPVSKNPSKPSTINEIEEHVFQSSRIWKGQYRRSDGTLKLFFPNGSTYASEKSVPKELWERFKKAKSAGTFFQEEIIPYWNGRKL